MTKQPPTFNADEVPAGQPITTTQTNIATEGGAFVQGNVAVGGDLIGRDQLIIHVQNTEEALAVQERLANARAERDGTFARLPFEPETVLVPGGPFLMGSDTDDPEEAPQHEVTLPDFRIGKYPVTNAEYAEFVRQSAHQPPQRVGWFLREPPAGKERHPVVAVSWHDAWAYCEWLSTQTKRRYRLPTEAEWEKAASGPGNSARRYPWATSAVLAEQAHWAADYVQLGEGTAAVDAHPQGASPYGCCALLGNVQEWTLTIWGSDENVSDFPYPQNSATIDQQTNDPAATHYATRVYRIHRGGSYRSNPSDLRVSARGRSMQDSKVAWRGFRIVMEIT